MRSLSDALKGVTRLAFDTAPVIYFVEANPTYVGRVREILRRVNEGEIEAITSAITLAEVLVQPLRVGRPDLVSSYSSLLPNSASFSTVPLDTPAARRAA